jgi:hypothetical protein
MPQEEGWTYRCKGLTAEIIDESGSQGIVEILEALTRRHLGDGSRVTRERERLGGRDAWVVAGSSADGKTFARGAIIERSEGYRLVGCTCGDDARCARVLDVLAQRAWRAAPVPGVVNVAPPSGRLGGRTVEAPRGCELSPNDGDEGAMIRCPVSGARVHWVDAADDDRAEEALAGFEQLAKSLGAAATWEQTDCRIAAQPARCTRVMALVGKEGVPQAVGVLLWGSAAVNGRRVAAWCKHLVGRGGSIDAVPPPCDVVFSSR